jgi:hypothetical protein
VRVKDSNKYKRAWGYSFRALLLALGVLTIVDAERSIRIVVAAALGVMVLVEVGYRVATKRDGMRDGDP